MFYNIFAYLCTKKGVSTTKAALDLGFSRSAPNHWKEKNGRPKNENMQKIADYFNVTVDYLLTGQEPETKKDQPAEIDKLANTKVKQRLLEYLDTLPDEKIIALLTLIKNDEQ